MSIRELKNYFASVRADKFLTKKKNFTICQIRMQYSLQNLEIKYKAICVTLC